jgi:uncharacterized protein YcgI (DUF1989 family)
LGLPLPASIERHREDGVSFRRDCTREPGRRHRLEPQTGTAFVLEAGQTLLVVDPCGEQVADLVAFDRDQQAEWLSSGRSLDYAGTMYLTRGHTLYSNRSNPMLAIVEDDVGRHDFIFTPCSSDTFRILYDNHDPHPSCLDNLAGALEGFGIHADAIPTTFNVFMNVDVLADGALQINPPRSRAGDSILFRAERSLIVGLTACSAELSNNHAFKPIDYEVGT